MAVSTPHLYPVRLGDEQRRRLEDITPNGRAPAKKIRHAHVLLLSDADRPGGKMSRTRIAQAPGMHVNSVDRIRKRFALEGEAPAINRKARPTPPTPAVIDGKAEAHLVAICRGHAREAGVRQPEHAWHRVAVRGVSRRGGASSGAAAGVPSHAAPWQPRGWLNMAEIELRVLRRQCLDRRIESATQLADELAVWDDQRNKEACKVQWRMTTADARTALKRLYPPI